MSNYSFRIYCDTLGPKTAFDGRLEAANRIIYVRDGGASLHSAGQAMALAANSAWCGGAPCQMIAGANGAQLLRWELHRSESAPAVEGTQSRLLLERELNLPARDACLFRCDRVDFPPGGIAYTHTHQGPGIRCLLNGRFTVETAGHAAEIVPGGAWFESGPDPVLATAWDQSPTGFVRVMVLPRSLKGASSIKYVRPEDLQKPKSQQYQVFIDEFIDL